jgi:hypothetical protein
LTSSQRPSRYVRARTSESFPHRHAQEDAFAQNAPVPSAGSNISYSAVPSTRIGRLFHYGGARRALPCPAALTSVRPRHRPFPRCRLGGVQAGDGRRRRRHRRTELLHERVERPADRRPTLEDARCCPQDRSIREHAGCARSRPVRTTPLIAHRSQSAAATDRTDHATCPEYLALYAALAGRRACAHGDTTALTSSRRS